MTMSAESQTDVKWSSWRRLRVVTLLDAIGVSGGAERMAREILRGLDPERFERTLCVSRWSADQESDPAVAKVLAGLGDAGVRFIGLPRRSTADLAAWRPLLSVLRQERVDILHSHKFGSNVWAAILGPLAGTPVVIAHEHTWSFEGQPLRKFLDRRLIAPRVNAMLAVSSEDRRRMIEIEGISPEKVIFVPNGISTPAPTSGADVREELGVDPDAPVVGTVCVLRPQKALEVLIDAAQPLARQFPDLRVLIVGSGPEADALEQRIEQRGLTETVKMIGRRRDIPDVLRAFDVGVSCSDFEGMPLSVLEYMEAGLPVVATRVGGVPDLISAGEQGLLVEPRDAGGLAAAIAELLSDPTRAAAMGNSGRRRRRAEFDLGRTVAEIERIYTGMAGDSFTVQD